MDACVPNTELLSEALTVQAMKKQRLQPYFLNLQFKTILLLQQNILFKKL